MEKKNHEKRIHNRYLFDGTLSYMRMGDMHKLPDTDYSVAEIADISSGGLRLKLNQPMLNEGSLLITKFPVSGTSATIPVIARVQWINKESENSFQAGIKFIIEN